MIRFFILLLLSFFVSVITNAQNLIPDWSAEDYFQCPNSLGPVDAFLSQWIAYRGTSDYFHSCCQQPGLCWSNDLGYQEPKSGEGYIGAFSYNKNLTNAREYFGIELTEPLVIGQTYFVSFYTSLAFSSAGGSRYATNRLGFLLMTENYLSSNYKGGVPNFAHYSLDSVITDTLNWVKVSSTIVADSAYTQIAFGNFFDDQSIEVTEPFGTFTSGFAYNYFDDFCVSTDSLACDEVLSTSRETEVQLSIFPNPCKSIVQFACAANIIGIDIFSSTGQKINSIAHVNSSQGELDINVPAGIYVIQFFTSNGFTTKRIVVQ